MDPIFRKRFWNSIFRISVVVIPLTIGISYFVGTLFGLQGETWRAYLISQLVICMVFILLAGGWHFNEYIKPAIRVSLNLKEAMDSKNLDIRTELNTHNEIAEANQCFSSLISSMQILLKGIQKASAQLSDNVTQLSQTSTALLEGTKTATSKTVDIIEISCDMKPNIEDTAEGLSNVDERIRDISISIGEMTDAIRSLASIAGHLSHVVSRVTGIVADISTNIGEASEAANNVSGSVNNVAESIFEISASLEQIRRNCERSTRITREAELGARDANNTIEKLDGTSKKIGKVIELINDIADQTNMLALNAAIEAAGAGASGSGFTIVANEVKELAEQTALATEEIADEIAVMQLEMKNVVKGVAGIGEVITEISSITDTIAVAVTQQSSITGSIARDITTAAEKSNHVTAQIQDIAGHSTRAANILLESSNGVDELAVSTRELSKASAEIAQNATTASERMGRIKKYTFEMSYGIEEILKNANETKDILDKMSVEEERIMDSKTALESATKRIEGLTMQYKI